MFHPLPARWLATLPAIAALTAVAQTTPTPSPSPANVAQPALPFRSVLDGFQTFAEEKAVPWKEANETVYRRGGWRAYAKEASEQGSSESESPKGGADPHAGHSMPLQKKEQP